MINTILAVLLQINKTVVAAAFCKCRYGFETIEQTEISLNSESFLCVTDF